MARFAIVLMPLEPGHHNAAAALAAKLLERGHDVRFVGVAEDRPAIEERGFSFLPVTLAKVSAITERTPSVTSGGEWPSFVRRARGLWRHYVLRRRLLAGLARAQAALGEFDAVIVDGLLLAAALAVARTGRPTVLLHTTFSPYNPSMPPFWTPCSPTQPGVAGVWAWACERWTRVRTALVALCGPHLSGARGERFHLAGSLTRWQALVESLPAIIACPRALDFPAPALPSERYASPLVDIHRAEEPLDLPDLPTSCTGGLVLVSMGTQHWLMRNPLRFFNVVALTASVQPDLFFVIVAGDLAPALARAHALPNLLVLRSGPQLRMLSRAALMINHGGLNTVKECVLMGVPMICFPIERDQPGNAARVAWHGLGLRGDYRTVTPAELAGMLGRVIGDRGFRASVDRMRDDFVAQDAGAMVRFIEEAALLTQPSRAADARRAWP